MQPRKHHLPIHNSWTTSGQHEVVFFDWGDENSEDVIVCVHGLTRNAHDFDIIAPRLAQTGRRVFTINMPGRGESAWLDDPRGYTYPSYAADCLAILDNFHFRRVEWLGTSMGGIIGMTLAAQQPGRIKKLILNDIGSYLSAAALQRIYDYVGSMPSQFDNRAAAEAYLAAAFAPFGITDPVQWQQFVDGSLLPQADGSLRYACDPAIAVPLRLASNNFTEVADINLSALWELIQIPSLVLRGEQSDVLSADTVAAMQKSNPKLDSLVVPGVGHAPALMSDSQIRPLLNWLTRDVASVLAAGF